VVAALNSSVIAIACQMRLSVRWPLPDPSARAIDDRMPPPMAPAETMTSSMYGGNTSAMAASASTPSLATQ
jgi:hypothetical protein